MPMHIYLNRLKSSVECLYQSINSFLVDIQINLLTKEYPNLLVIQYFNDFYLLFTIFLLIYQSFLIHDRNLQSDYRYIILSIFHILNYLNLHYFLQLLDLNFKV